MALPSLDNVPLAYLKADKDTDYLMVPDVIQTWLSNLIDTMNEALIEIDSRLTAGGL